MGRAAGTLSALGLALLASCGSGGGDPSEPPAPNPTHTHAGPGPSPAPTATPDPSDCLLPDGELVVVPVTFSGRRVILRLDGCGLQIVTPSPQDLAAMNLDRRGRFSSPDVLWGVGLESSRCVITRSNDAGSTWTFASELPGDLSCASDLHVDRSSEGELTAWVAMAGIDSVATPGPEIWRRPLEHDAGWEQIPGIPQTPFLSSDPLRTWIAPRAGRVELLRNSAGEVALEILTGERLTVPITEFGPGDYTTFDDRGWIGGSTSSLGDESVPAVTQVSTVDGAVALEVRAIAGIVSSIDFRDEQHGFACGWKEYPDAFCAFSDDAGTTWTLGELPADLGRATIGNVVRTGGDTGFATWQSASLIRSGILATRDGGRRWTQVALPDLAPQLFFGPLARSSSALDAGPAPRPGPTALPPAPTPIPPPLTGDEPGPLVWLAGEAAGRGPGVTGSVLRSADGGDTWTELLAATGAPIVDLAFLDRNVGWAVGGRRILRTTDGGTTFVDQTPNVTLAEPVLRVDLVRAADATHAIVKVLTESERPNADTILVTSDGGARWDAATVPRGPFPRDLSDACLTRAGAGIMSLGQRIYLSADFGRSWIHGPTFPYETPCCTGDTLGDPRLACSGDHELWILVGGHPRGDTLWHSPDGGANWRDLSDAIRGTETESAMAGAFLDSGSAWLALRDGTGQVLLFRSRDGGDSWQSLPSPFRFDGPPRSYQEWPYAITFSDDSRGIALVGSFGGDGRGSLLLRTVDGGDSWLRDPPPTGFTPTAIATVP